MKIEGILWCGVALMAAVVISSLALAGEKEADWSSQSPLAFGEPMEDCGAHHPALIAKDDLLPTIVPAVVTPAAVSPAVLEPALLEAEPAASPLPVKQDALPPKPQLSPGQLSPGALFTFALIASPGSQLPAGAK